MRETIDIKEKIINIRTELIKQYDGDNQRITARMIAQKAEIALGLIIILEVKIILLQPVFNVL